MKVACDLDNTIDAAPQQMQSLMSALMAAGHRVTVVTGTQSDQATQQDFDDKANYLNSLGCGQSFDDLVVLAAPPGDLANAKAEFLSANGYHVLIDNDKGNAKAATKAGVPLVLVPWASRTP